MEIKLFYKQDCPRCPAAKEICKKLEEHGHPVNYYDAESVDGMAEAMFYMVMATPTLIVLDDKGNEIAAWRGSAPELDEVLSVLK
jgi:thioredoxin-related protein